MYKDSFFTFTFTYLPIYAFHVPKDTNRKQITMRFPYEDFQKQFPISAEELYTTIPHINVQTKECCFLRYLTTPGLWFAEF